MPTEAVTSFQKGSLRQGLLDPDNPVSGNRGAFQYFSVVFVNIIGYGQDLATAIHSALEVDVVRAAELTGILVLDDLGRGQGVMGAPHVTLAAADFLAWDGHCSILWA